MALKNDLIKHVIALTLIFTALDYIAHYFGFLVPKLEYLLPHYFLYKILFLPIILYILIEYLSFRGYLLYSIAAGTLAIRYYMSGIYSLQTNIMLYLVHFGLLCLAAYIDKQFEKSWY